MKTNLKYMPVFRVRQQEVDVLKSFEFGERIFPCIEIIKELDRLPGKPRKVTKKPRKEPKKKNFEDVYLPIVEKIKSKKVFIDLPVHLDVKRTMKAETIDFLNTVVRHREVRTEYMLRFAPFASKVIPVVSSYFQKTGEAGTIQTQLVDLRKVFSVVAVRTFAESFFRDIVHVEGNLKKTDYLIMDWKDEILNLDDAEQMAINERLAAIKCTVIIHRSPISTSLTNVSLVHGAQINDIDNSHLEKYLDYSGDAFSDYSGIKKDDISKGGGISPGFIYYDAVRNKFFGYKGTVNAPVTFTTVIVPAVIASAATVRMTNDTLDFLGLNNIGWEIINRINTGLEPGGSAAKFKRIGMEHYLHCIKEKITNGDFD